VSIVGNGETPLPTRVGWVGTGVMGRWMCGHLLDAGYRVTVFNRSREKAKTLLDLGATFVPDPGQVAAASDVVFTIVGYPQDVREVYLGDAGLIAAANAGTVLVDMTTSQPSLAKELAAAGSKRGIDVLDAPVSGGDIGAKEARLSIMIGGDARPVKQVWPLFERMGKTIVHQGGPGAGQHTKMVNQTLIASNMIGVCEALLYGYAAGLDLEKVLQSVSSGAAGSWSLTNLAPRITNGDFAPGFYVEHFIKDMKIALDEANRMDLVLPGLSLARMLYETLRSQGHAKDGTQALMLALAQLSRRDWASRS
jgi:3-hydroxyisobutyrate dehydrogenase